jgi:hypothetical protein
VPAHRQLLGFANEAPGFDRRTSQRLEDVLKSEGVILVEEDEQFYPAIRIRKPQTLFPTELHSPEAEFAFRYRPKPPNAKTKPKKPRKRMR